MDDKDIIKQSNTCLILVLTLFIINKFLMSTKFDLKRKSIICWWLGHKKNDMKDAGYLMCDRCRKHEYHDSDFHDGQPFRKAYRWISSIFNEF